MSRIGKIPVVLVKGVTAKLDGGLLNVKGAKGSSSLCVSEDRYPLICVEVKADSVAVTRKDDSREARTQQGLIRALIQNMVIGVHDGYSRTLDVVGVGYKADLKGKILVLNLGYSHPIDYPLPDGITATVDKQTRIVVSGVDKKLVGETAACIRRFRSPEPYKGKGVRYADEIIRRKVGKTAAGASGGK